MKKALYCKYLGNQGTIFCSPPYVVTVLKDFNNTPFLTFSKLTYLLWLLRGGWGGFCFQGRDTWQFGCHNLKGGSATPRGWQQPRDKTSSRCTQKPPQHGVICFKTSTALLQLRGKLLGQMGLRAFLWTFPGSPTQRLSIPSTPQHPIARWEFQSVQYFSRCSRWGQGSVCICLRVRSLHGSLLFLLLFHK